MPHIVFKQNNNLKIPSSIDGVSFDFIAKSYNIKNSKRSSEYKIAVTKNNQQFLLTKKNKNDVNMIKYDKTTRISPVSFVKDAMNAYSKLTNANVLFTNTNTSTTHINDQIKTDEQYLKNIEYIVNEFQTNKSIQIEIGFGSGKHILYQAKQNPNVQFFGLEIHTPSIEQLLKQIKIQNIANIIVINYDARLFMEFIKSNSVDSIFVHFPVPWDKKPHRRIYSNEFVNEALRVLKKNATLELRTDSKKYFDYSISLLSNLNSGKIIIDINKDLDIISKYEKRWRKQEKTIYDIVLKCQEEYDIPIQKYNFDFEGEVNFDAFTKSITTKAIVEKDYFIHIENMFDILNQTNSGLIKLTFGNFNRPLNKYIIINNGKASYFQDKPIPTSSNIKAHKHLKKILNND